MNIVPDPILVAVQILPFLVLMTGLHLILFKPMLAYLDRRKAATVGARAEAAALQAQSGAALDRYEHALTAARAEIADIRAGARAEANAAHAAKVAAARAEVDARVGAALVQLRADATAARSGLGSQAQGIAADVARQVLGRELTVEA